MRRGKSMERLGLSPAFAASRLEQPLLRRVQPMAIEKDLAITSGDVADLGLALKQLGIGGDAEALLQVDGNLYGRAGHRLVERGVAAGKLCRSDRIAVDINPRRIGDAG